MLIAERIGHDDTKYIMETYGHIFTLKNTLKWCKHWKNLIIQNKNN